MALSYGPQQDGACVSAHAHALHALAWEGLKVTAHGCDHIHCSWSHAKGGLLLGRCEVHLLDDQNPGEATLAMIRALQLINDNLAVCQACRLSSPQQKDMRPGS